MPWAIVGVSGNDKLAITLILVNITLILVNKSTILLFEFNKHVYIYTNVFYALDVHFENYFNRDPQKYMNATIHQLQNGLKPT